MSRIKKHAFTISVILILCAVIGLSVFSIIQYGNHSAANSQSSMQPGLGAKGNSAWNRNGSDSTPPVRGPQGNNATQNGTPTPPNGGMFPSDGSTPSSNGNMTPPNGNAPSFNGSMAPPDGNMDSFRGNGGSNRGMPAFRGGIQSNGQYSTALAIYAGVILALFVAVFILIIRKKWSLKIRPEKQTILLWALLGIGLFLRIAAAPWINGHPFDISLFKNWATSAADHFSTFYVNGSSDYPPFYIYILYGVGKIASLPAMSSYMNLLIKLPSLLADVATTYLIYKLARKYLTYELSLLISAFYLFNPAVLINSTFWGQVDSFFTLLIVAALLLLSSKKLAWATVIFTAAVLMKPQGVIFLPILFFELVRRKRIRDFLTVGLTSLFTAVLLILPFSFSQEPLWIFKLFSHTLGEYPYASVNAFNFFSLLGANYVQDSTTLFVFSYHTWGLIFITLITLYSWWIYGKGRSAKYAALTALLQITGVFTFSASMHERYLFPAAALALLAFAYLQDKRLLWLFAGFSATIFLNTYVILYGSLSGGAAYSAPLFLTSVLNVGLFVYLAIVAWDIAIRKRTRALPLDQES